MLLEQAVSKLSRGLPWVQPHQLTVHKAALAFVAPERRKLGDQKP